MTENKAFTEKAISRVQSMGPTLEAFAILDYLFMVDRVRFAYDMMWVKMVDGSYQILTAFVEIDNENSPSN